MCTQKMRALSYIGAEKITFPPKPDRQSDIRTYRRTDISIYRVASLLKREMDREGKHYQYLLYLKFRKYAIKKLIVSKGL